MSWPFGNTATPYRLSVAQYRRMIEVGIFHPDERVELLEGLLIKQFRPMTPRECAPQRRFMRLLTRLEGTGWHVRFRTAITLSDSEPEPDVVFVRDEPMDYATRFAGPSEVGIVVEIADASLELDRRDKGRIYARAAIPVYWVINVADKQVEVYTDPEPAANPPEYRTRKDYRPGDSVPVALDGQPAGSIAVSDLIP